MSAKTVRKCQPTPILEHSSFRLVTESLQDYVKTSRYHLVLLYLNPAQSLPHHSKLVFLYSRDHDSSMSKT